MMAGNIEFRLWISKKQLPVLILHPALVIPEVAGLGNEFLVQGHSLDEFAPDKHHQIHGTDLLQNKLDLH